MNKLNIFDVLVVYTESLAVSASGACETNNTPFPEGSKNESYNEVYGYFLEVCRRKGLKAAFSTSTDITGPGTCGSFWIYKDKMWIKKDEACMAELIFDKFSPTRRKIKIGRKLLFSTDEVKAFNDSELFDLFFDKQRTYRELSDFSIPTVSVSEKTAEGVEKACSQLAELVLKHNNSEDFHFDIVMKDRFGAGGKHIYKFKAADTAKMYSVVKRNARLSFVIQPFTKFDEGFVYRNKAASTDVRLIYLNGEIVQSYIRVAKTGDYRCNEHKGGLLTYLRINEIPDKLIERANLIAAKLNKKSFFALDFLVSNNGNVYLLEGNAGPGLDWNLNLKRNEIEAKKLIRLIVGELVTRVNKSIVKDDGVVSVIPYAKASTYQVLV